MKNMKKAVVLILAVLVILASVRFSFAAQILTGNEVNEPQNTQNDASTLDTNTSDENAVTDVNEVADENNVQNTMNEANSVDEPVGNNTSLNATQNNVENEVEQNVYYAGTENNTTMNTTNATEDLPSTGIEDTYLNFAFNFLLFR